jgi:carboxypeptidase family protein
MKLIGAGRNGTRAAALIVLVVMVVAACSGVTGASSASPSVPPSPAGPPRGIGGRATAGPVCPVLRVPPDRACAARPVVGAVVLVRDATGREVGRATTDADGRYVVFVEPGSYVVVAQPTGGLMGTPPPQSVTVDGDITQVDLSYDTGIR